MEKHIMALSASDEKSDDPFLPLEERALGMAVEETFENTGGKWKPWACNARSLRIGEIILIIDSDTIVPEDCFRDAARELHECPEVAIIQHESGEHIHVSPILNFLITDNSNLLQTSCKSRTTTSRTALPISQGVSTSVFRWVVPTERSRRSLVIMPS